MANNHVKCPKCGSHMTKLNLYHYGKKGAALAAGFGAKALYQGAVGLITGGRFVPPAKATVFMSNCDDEYTCSKCYCEFSVKKDGTKVIKS